MIDKKELLKQAKNAYYNTDSPIMSDKEYDLLVKEIGEESVGAPVLDSLKKVNIVGKPMLSLNKCHSSKEIIDFSDGYDIIASIKCDGLSVRIIYKEGLLISANTRGDSKIGQDITEHIKYFLNVPIKIAKSGTYIIDGEAIIYDDDFAIINKNNEFKNNRNTASGSLALLDMSVVKNRRLSFIAWDIIEGGKANEYHYNLEEAEELGFTIVPALALDCTKIEEEEIDDINQTLLTEAKEKGIPCDGIVWRINDIQAGEKRGQTAHHFLNAIAWKKPNDEEYETKLLDIDFDVSRNGVLTPVAVFEPVKIDGTEVSRASLHNISIMIDTLGHYPELHQPIWVCKKNQIIPQITRAVKNDIPHDHIIFNRTQWIACPICGSKTEVITSDAGVMSLVCTNPECEGKLAQRIDHYCGKKGLDIKGFSRKTIEKLIDWGWINGLADIYKLSEHRTEWVAKAGFGENSVDKILKAINQAGRHPKLDAFISGLGIQLVGRTVAKTIAKEFSSWQEFRDYIDTDDCFFDVFDGIGEEINNSIKNFDYTEADKIVAEELTFKQPEIQNNVSTPAAAIKDKVFCATGKLISGQFKNRDELKADIEANGGKMVSSISSKVDYLISNTPDSGTAKNKKAQELGIKIITEQDYIDMTS